MAERAEAKHDIAGQAATEPAVDDATRAVSEKYMMAPYVGSESKDHVTAEKATDTTTPTAESVFGMFGGSKKKETVEEEENDRSGSSKAKAKEAEVIYPIHRSTTHQMQPC
jgi:hypothetical protein